MFRKINMYLKKLNQHLFHFLRNSQYFTLNINAFTSFNVKTLKLISVIASTNKQFVTLSIPFRIEKKSRWWYVIFFKLVVDIGIIFLKLNKFEFNNIYLKFFLFCIIKELESYEN